MRRYSGWRTAGTESNAGLDGNGSRLKWLMGKGFRIYVRGGTQIRVEAGVKDNYAK